MVDDALDYSATAEQMGKNTGDDLSDGKTTLPLIYALDQCSSDEQDIISESISEGKRDNLDQIKQIIESTGALAYTSDQAKKHAAIARQSLDGLPVSEYRTALAQLADFSVSRTF